MELIEVTYTNEDGYTIPYRSYLCTSHWQRRSKFVLEQLTDIKGPCPICNQTKRKWEVYHRNFDNLGKETVRDMQAMCEACWIKLNRERGILVGKNPHGKLFPPKDKTDYKSLSNVT